MHKWLIVHSLEAYNENPRMIGFQAKTNIDGTLYKDDKGKPLPFSNKIKEIQPGDVIVYYCKGDYVIKGIYEIVRQVFGKEKKWEYSPFQFEIKPVKELDDPVNFKSLVSSLELFEGLSDIRWWGSYLQGVVNSIRLLSDHDFSLIEKSIVQASRQTKVDEEEEKQNISDYRQHLRIQHKIAEWGLKSGYRVHVAINDRSKIKENLPSILEDMPNFLRDDVIDIAKRVDILFFEKDRDILTHAFEIEHTTNIYSGLLRLNDIAESLPSERVKFNIISNSINKDKFNREIIRPSFRLLRKYDCKFIDYKEVDEAWKELQIKKSPIF